MKGIEFEYLTEQQQVSEVVTIESSGALRKSQPTQSPFNERGMVANPGYRLVRPKGPTDQIEFSITAHSLAADCWIAEPSWHCHSGHTPGHSQIPSRQSVTFQTRSEAVEDAISRGLRQVGNDLAHLKEEPKWAHRVHTLHAWSRQAIQQLRANDESLPLHGIEVIDLACGGLGGFGMGLTSLGATVTLACDIDANARSIYQANVRPTRMHGDICTLDGKNLSCDILTMGLMCQAFSKSGKGLGFADPKLRSAYEHTLRLLREIDAKVVVIECVRQLLTANGGKDVGIVKDTLLQAGYRVQHRTMNAKGFGLPQNRERIFLVASRVDLALDDVIGYVFPREHTPSTVVADILDWHIATDLPNNRIAPRKPEPQHRQCQMVEVGRLDNRDSQGYRVYSTNGLGATLTAMGGGRAKTSIYAINGNARALTPREACRMQGLPEWATHHVTKTHAYKHAGNAVAVPIARELARNLAAILRPSMAGKSPVMGGAA